MLVQAAARQWNVDPAACRTENGEVIHDASGRKLAYGELVAGGRRLTPPQDPPLKARKDFKLIGKPLKRLDTPDKVNGKAHLRHRCACRRAEVRDPRRLPGVRRQGRACRRREAQSVPGVRQVVVLDDIVAVVGDHMWAAKQGLDALAITWDEGPNAECHVRQMLSRTARRQREGRALVAKSIGDADKALAPGDELEATYELPFLAHAPMEPMNCTVHVKPDACEMWVGNQVHDPRAGDRGQG